MGQSVQCRKAWQSRGVGHRGRHPLPSGHDPLHGAAGAPFLLAPALAHMSTSGKIWCCSDLHTDHDENLRWCEQLAVGGRYRSDVLIVPGDITGNRELLARTLRALKGAFATVFFTPGNHDLWVIGKGTEGWDPQRANSANRLEDVLELCHSLGVQTLPALAAGAIARQM